MVSPVGNGPRRQKHRFTGAALMIFFGGAASLYGGLEAKVAIDNPAPTRVECAPQLFDRQGASVWLEVSGCTFDLDAALEVSSKERTETLYVPLRTSGGEAVGLVASDDEEVIRLTASLSWRMTEEQSVETIAAIAERFDGESVVGLTTRPLGGDRDLLEGRVEGFTRDSVVLEQGKEPSLQRGLVLLGIGLVLLVLGAVFYQRAKNGKAEEDERIAEFYRHSAQSPGGNPYLR